MVRARILCRVLPSGLQDRDVPTFWFLLYGLGYIRVWGLQPIVSAEFYWISVLQQASHFVLGRRAGMPAVSE